LSFCRFFWKLVRISSPSKKTKKEEKDWISINVDRSKILTVGLPALKNFLLRLNVFKATADL